MQCGDCEIACIQVIEDTWSEKYNQGDVKQEIDLI